MGIGDLHGKRWLFHTFAVGCRSMDIRLLLNDDSMMLVHVGNLFACEVEVFGWGILGVGNGANTVRRVLGELPSVKVYIRGLGEDKIHIACSHVPGISEFYRVIVVTGG